MANLTQWGRSSMRALQRDLDDLMQEFTVPRSFRREVEGLFEDDLSARSLSREMDRLLDEFASPPPLRRRIASLFEGLGGLRIPLLSREAGFAPQVELKELDGEYVLKADLPGVRDQDVDVRIGDDNVLTVTG